MILCVIRGLGDIFMMGILSAILCKFAAVFSLEFFWSYFLLTLVLLPPQPPPPLLYFSSSCIFHTIIYEVHAVPGIGTEG